MPITDQPIAHPVETRLVWEEPCLTLERPLELRARAQGPVGGQPWNPGNLGPLSASGGKLGGCT